MSAPVSPWTRLAATLHIHPEILVSGFSRWLRRHDQILMFSIIAAVIYGNCWGLAAPCQNQGQSQDDAVTGKPADFLFHDSPLVFALASSE